MNWRRMEPGDLVLIPLSLYYPEQTKQQTVFGTVERVTPEVAMVAWDLRITTETTEVTYRLREVHPRRGLVIVAKREEVAA